MPIVKPGEDARVSEGLNRMDINLSKGQKMRVALMTDYGVSARRHFIEKPEESTSTVVACERDYGNKCLACDNATGSYETPIQEAKHRHVFPVLVFENASKKNGLPTRSVVKDGKYTGELTPAIWDFGWGKDWNYICDHGDDTGGLEGAELIIEMTNPGNKQLSLSFPRRTFLADDAIKQALAEYEEVNKEPFPELTKIESTFVAPRVTKEIMEELVANSGAEINDIEDDGDEGFSWGDDEGEDAPADEGDEELPEDE